MTESQLYIRITTNTPNVTLMGMLWGVYCEDFGGNWPCYYGTTLVYVLCMGMFLRERQHVPDSKVHGANMGTTWVLSAPDGPHVGPINLAIRAGLLDFIFALKPENCHAHFVTLMAQEVVVMIPSGIASQSKVGFMVSSAVTPYCWTRPLPGGLVYTRWLVFYLCIWYLCLHQVLTFPSSCKAYKTSSGYIKNVG